MGNNSSVVVLNDALHNISNDSEFGKRLNAAIAESYCYRRSVDVRAGGFVNAATVIESHHANQVSAILIGGNYGIELTQAFGDPRSEETQLTLIKEWAEKLGYKLVKKK